MTNSLSFLPQTDEILLIENGQIMEKGTYDELKNGGAAFSDFIKNSMEAPQEEKKEESNNIKNPTDLKAPSDQVSPNKPENVPNIESSKLPDKAKTIEPEKKTGEKIIVKEKIESGKVNF